MIRLKGQGYDVPFVRYFTLRFPAAAGVPLPSAPNRTTHDKAPMSLIVSKILLPYEVSFVSGADVHKPMTESTLDSLIEHSTNIVWLLVP
jgi:hypothetical protein